MSFAERLREVMRERRPAMTQAELADRVGVTTGAVSGWMRGTKPYPKHVQRICLALGVRLDWLLYGEGEKYLRTGIVQETPMPTGYGRMEKVRFIQEHAPEMLPLLDAYLESMVEKFGPAHGREPQQRSDQSSDQSRKARRDPRSAQ